MFSFNSVMNLTSQSQTPNSCNPNPHLQLSHTPNHQLISDDSPFFQIADYIMSDVEFGYEEYISMKSKDVSEDYSYGSSNSIPFNVMIPGRGLKMYDTQEELIRFAFRTKTDLEFMDDGYKWRKYGKKMVKNNPNPRNYFKCSSGGCNVKKRVERDSEDPSYVITTYQGIHNHHSPSTPIHSHSLSSSIISS